MQVYIVDAFTDQVFYGNPAGVVYLGAQEPFPDKEYMRKVAEEMRYSETAFVKKLDENSFCIRCFTPKSEVALCGHATVATFTVLRAEGLAAVGQALAKNAAGNLKIEIQPNNIWMETAAPQEGQSFNQEQTQALSASLGLTTMW